MLTKTAQRRGHSVIVFSGYRLDELVQKPLNREITEINSNKGKITMLGFPIGQIRQLLR